MLLPRFTIRYLLALTAALAVVSLILSLALRGQAWALAILLALASGVTLLALHVAAFLVASAVARARRALRPDAAAASPFASAGLPRQFVPPPEGE